MKKYNIAINILFWTVMTAIAITAVLFLNFRNEKVISFVNEYIIKPEKEIYQAVEIVSGFKSEEHIFIDDILEYVNAAKSLGWDGIQFLGYDDLVLNLRQRNII